jgi:virulence-associated protein VapD
MKGGAAMIKMQIIIDDDKVARETTYNAAKIHQVLDNYMVNKLGFRKAPNGFYLGADNAKDFSRFGIAFSTLRHKEWFAKSVKTWLYFNSDASDDPEDYVIEDFTDYFDIEQPIVA